MEWVMRTKVAYAKLTCKLTRAGIPIPGVVYRQHPYQVLGEQRLKPHYTPKTTIFCISCHAVTAPANFPAIWPRTIVRSQNIYWDAVNKNASFTCSRNLFGMTKGSMIVCDGGNGAGKSTVLKAIAQHLQVLGHDSLITREPGGTPIGEKIREILLSTDSSEMCDITELMLFAAARAQHVQEKIIPAINAGKIVISDRFDSATVSFQHFARGLPLDVINTLNDLATDGFKPDLTIILDLDPLTGLERVNSRGSRLDRMEKEDLEFLNNARLGYLKQATDDPARFRVIDASQPLELVVFEALQIVDQVIDLQHQKN